MLRNCKQRMAAVVSFDTWPRSEGDKALCPSGCIIAGRVLNPKGVLRGEWCCCGARETGTTWR